MNLERNVPTAGLEQSKVRYERAADTIAELAEEITSIPIPEEVLSKWKTLLSAIRIIDDRIDHTADDATRLALTEGIRTYLKSGEVDFTNDTELATAVSNVYALTRSMNEDQQAFFNTLISSILRTTENIRTEETAAQMARLTMLEGQLTAELFLPFLPSEFVQSEQYPKLVKAFTRLGRAANAFDTFVDLKADYAGQQTRVLPTLRNRLAFLEATVLSGSSLLSDQKLSRVLLTLATRGVYGTIADSPKDTDSNP